MAQVGKVVVAYRKYLHICSNISSNYFNYEHTKYTSVAYELIYIYKFNTSQLFCTGLTFAPNAGLPVIMLRMHHLTFSGIIALHAKDHGIVTVYLIFHLLTYQSLKQTLSSAQHAQTCQYVVYAFVLYQT